MDIRDKALRVDREILFEGTIPAAAVKTGGMMIRTRGAQVVSRVGIVLTVYDLEQAGAHDYKRERRNPTAMDRQPIDQSR